MSERRSLRRKPLADRTNANTPIFSPSPSLKPKPSDTPRTRTKTKPSLSNSLTSTGSNDAQQLQQQHQNPSVDLPHSSTPQPNHSGASDDADRPVVEVSRTYTRLSTDGKKKRDKGKAAAASIPSSCPPVGRFRSFSHEWDKVEGEHGDVVPSKACLLAHLNKNKKPRHSKPSSTNKHILPQDFIDKQRAYFAEIDAFELPVEVASESELE